MVSPSPAATVRLVSHHTNFALPAVLGTLMCICTVIEPRAGTDGVVAQSIGPPTWVIPSGPAGFSMRACHVGHGSNVMSALVGFDSVTV